MDTIRSQDLRSLRAMTVHQLLRDHSYRVRRAFRFNSTKNWAKEREIFRQIVEALAGTRS